LAKAGLTAFEWMAEKFDWTLRENGDVIVISIDADPDLIDSLAAEYGKRGDWLNTRRE
jgi:hypothetical protein